ncbi:catecholate siderophore receptor Fiu [Massilia sp. PAMC28688]|uniref:catecholate siderophore receptor Fiu n=1 Tax=Massilia sp. PAMC28688 TaxID=2861283 RepID=UPI001C63035E|nr:catecholate siderophore receptor Fiu [Massilia sp. PAMC28688]QYF92280.1 catecholate siderophore receptor Fiu [Massilia sp. PAMC28688]
MSYIRNRKHVSVRQPILSHSLIALAALAPFAAHAQDAAGQEKKLKELTVTATADVPFKADKVSSPKLTEPLLDTPQTIAVIKKELIAEQGATSIMEALRNTPGITLQLGENGNTSAGDTFQMRGFATQTSVFVDGVRDLGPVSRDAFNVEQIEVSKGPAGADIGRGATSGYVNLVSKSAQADNFNLGTVSINSGNNKRVTADINRSLSPTSAVRLNVMGYDGGVIGRDHIEASGMGVAPSLVFGLGTPTRVTLGTQHIRQDNDPDGGLPSIGLPGFNNVRDPAVNGGPRVRTENYYGLASDYEKIDADMATVKIEHDFAGGAKLSNISRFGKSNMDRILTGINIISAEGQPANPAAWVVSRSRQSVLQDNEIMANLTNVVSDFTIGNVAHTVSAGLELLSEKQLSTNRGGLGVPPPANLYKPNVHDVAVDLAPAPNGAYTRGSTTTAAVYAFDTAKLTEQFHLNGGLRVEHYSTDTNSAAFTNNAVVPGDLLENSDTLVSWKIGALYKPTVDSSIYAAAASSKTPPGSANFALSASPNNVNRPNTAPQNARNVEIGGKWDVLAKKLALTAAAYRTENTNEIVTIDAQAGIYAQTGRRRVQGVELGMVGQFTRAWNVTAGVATMKSKVLEGGVSGLSAQNSLTRWSPDLTATLWSSYAVNDKFTIGGGARYVSEQKRVVDPNLSLATQNVPEIPSYSVLDAVLSYKVSPHLSLQLNVYNLADKFYLSTLNNGGSRFALGTGRSAQLTANIAF